MKLLGVNADAKTKKGAKLGVLTGIMYLAPSNESGVLNTCPNASKGCRTACLFTAGRGAFNSVKFARILKTIKFMQKRIEFMGELISDVVKLARKADKAQMVPAVRLNGTSDIAWEQITIGSKNIMELFPTIQFYDYTKSIKRVRSYAAQEFPANYHLTFSRSESNQDEVEEAIKLGVNVAVVFADKSFPTSYLGAPVVNGDETDVRFNDPKGCIVGLKAKGKARKDKTGFVIEVK